MERISLDNILRKLNYQINRTTFEGSLSKQNIANFLNVPYAKVTQRFRPAKPVNLSDLPTVVNATHYGPRCPQYPGDGHIAMRHLFEKVSAIHQWSDETDCLNLNIYAPPTALNPETASKLPVFVWIHGGAFNSGDNTVQFDGNHLVKRSMDLDQPMIVVVINYRLNILGFLSSRELRKESEKLGETHIVNQGLNDQRLALQWIQASVEHFGGDPSRVTLCGESAGAISIYCHLRTKIPLFQQAIIQSGRVTKFRSSSTAQGLFDGLVTYAGISPTASDTEKLNGVRRIPVQQLLNEFSVPVSIPFEDPQWFPKHKDEGKQLNTEDCIFDPQIPSWCSRIIIGNCQEETALMLAHQSGDTVSGKTAQGFMHFYDLQSALPACLKQDSVIDKRSFIVWSTYQVFIRPVIELTLKALNQSPANKLYQYRINCPDPYPSHLQGYSWHSYGIPFTFYQPACQTHTQLAAMTDSLTASISDFVYGGEPWESYNIAHRIQHFTNEGIKMMNASEDEHLRLSIRSPAQL